jgi:DNA-binding LacI/PurR family transcriptional regulator
VGFQEELGDLFDPALVEQGDYTLESAADAMQRLLDRAPDVDAVFAASDLMASGAMATLRRNGKRVPDDIAVAGFDDSGLAATLDPPLTTMRQPFDQVSDNMVDLLLRVIDGKEPPSVVLDTTLVVRQST